MTAIPLPRYDWNVNLRSSRTWLWIIAAASLLGLLNFWHYFLDDLARQRYGTAPTRFIEEMTGVYTAIVMIPIIVWIYDRFPWTAKRWPSALLANIGGVLLYTLLHTSLMASTRIAIFALLGMGRYDYGIMTMRYPMEAATDVWSYAFVLAVLNGIARIRAGRHAQLAAAELQTKLAQAQLENLRLQLNPHFLFNTLNAISAVMYEDVRKADEMLTKLSDFLRDVLASGSVQCVSLEEELRIERSYVDIMTTRLERRLDLTINVSPDAHQAQMPFMLLQPIIENCIRHGMGVDRGALDIDIRVRRDDGSTVVDVLDDGVGLPPSGALRGHGLANVQSRLAHMYGDASSFSIGARENGGTHVTLRFPYSAGAATQ